MHYYLFFPDDESTMFFHSAQTGVPSSSISHFEVSQAKSPSWQHGPFGQHCTGDLPSPLCSLSFMQCATALLINDIDALPVVAYKPTLPETRL